MFRKLLVLVCMFGYLFAYSSASRTGPVAGVMINRKVASARQTLLNRKQARENGDPRIRAIEDDDICVGIKKNDFIDNKVDDERYNNYSSKSKR